MRNMLIGAGLGSHPPKIYEDPRLREIDHGYNHPNAQKASREKEGWFWYRFDGGESPADCYDRAAGFISSMYRQLKRKPGPGGSQKDVVIVTHGMMVMTFVMRFMHLSVEEFETLDVPPNCSVVTIGPKELIGERQFETRKWAVTGLKLR
jgi:broad specificity phosphatase PhoE